MKLSYGYSTGQEENDPLVLLAFEVTADIFSKSFQHGQWIVDFLPFGMSITTSANDATVSEVQLSQEFPRMASGHGVQAKGS